MNSTARPRPFIACTGGVPGSGKTTIMRRLASYPGCSSSLIISEDLRRKHGLRDPFNSSFRTRLHELLVDEVKIRSDSEPDAILVDSNLLEKSARRQITGAVGDAWTRVFIAPHAALEVLRERVVKKFGVGYMYPVHGFSVDSVIDHSFYFGEPIFLEEALEGFDVIIFYRTDGGCPRWWSRTSDLDEFASSLSRKLTVEPVDSIGLHKNTSRVRISSWQDRWCWDPELTGLLAVSPERPAAYHARKRILETENPSELNSAVKTALGGFATSYPGLLRSGLGSVQLIVPSVRVVIHDGHGSILLIRRRDTAEWALIGGAHELDEAISDTARREAREETGVELGEMALVAVLSGPEHVVQDYFGNVNQGLVFVFSSEMSREISPQIESPETIDAAWFSLEERPVLSRRHELSLKCALEFEGTVLVA